MSVKIRAHYDGKTIIPDEPVNIPTNEPLVVEVSLKTERAAGKAAESITSLPFFGMWADRDDMSDSIAWVTKERERWNERLSVRD